jgi:uncharacterized protein YhfF
LPNDVYAFGDSPELADGLLALILSGEKRATASRRAIYTSGKHIAPVVGGHYLILDGAGDAACVIKTTAVEDVPFDEVTADFAAVEGEGDKSLAWWREAHLAYFARETEAEGTTFDPAELIVCEVFQCVWQRKP